MIFALKIHWMVKNFKQMRIFHLFQGDKEVNFGVYACSPSNSSFDAVFSEISISECLWKEHKIIQ